MRLARGNALSLSIPSDISIRLAAEDVADDFRRILGVRPEIRTQPAPADIAVTLDGGNVRPECFAMQTTDRTCRIAGGDARGCVYGLYHLPRAFLGVDPLRFWTDIDPAPVSSVEIPEGAYRSPAPVFRYRGWFTNDEDLLNGFPYGEGYAYTNLDLYREVYKAMNRLGMNLVHPATMLDCFDAEEEQAILLARDYGLRVTAPGAGADYAFRRWCEAHGVPPVHSWTTNRAGLETCWHAFQEKTAAYGNILWGVGYRGATDEPFWNYEAGAPSDLKSRGAIISTVIQRQWDMIREHDPRAEGIALLWDESSVLYAAGALEIPKGLIVVFTDDGRTQTMKRDFDNTPDEPKPGERRGIYYHLQFSTTGPRTVEANPPEKIAWNIAQAVRKHCTDYLMVNVGNIREMTRGIKFLSNLAGGAAPTEPAAFKQDFCRYYYGQHADAAARLYDDYNRAFVLLEAAPETPSFRLLLDGGHAALQEGLVELVRGRTIDQASFEKAFAWRMVRISVLRISEEDIRNRSEHSNPAIWRFQTLEAFVEFLQRELPPSLAKFEAVWNGVEALAARMEDAPARNFLLSHVGSHAAIMKALTASNLALVDAALALQAKNVPLAREHVTRAIAAMKAGIRERAVAMHGKWRTWFAGETNLSLPAHLAVLRRLRTSL